MATVCVEMRRVVATCLAEPGGEEGEGILRLRDCFASRTRHSAQGDKSVKLSAKSYKLRKRSPHGTIRASFNVDSGKPQ